jgi:hypothetical protein
MSDNTDKHTFSSDSDSETDINLEEYIKNENKNFKKIYQIQHVADDRFKFQYMGMFETMPTVPLGDFKFDDTKHCYLTSNFVSEEDIEKTSFLPMITLMVHKEGRIMNICMGIEFGEEIDLTKENNGSVFIGFIDEENNIGEILKKNLIYPGSTKLIYFLVGELKNDTIRKYMDK